MIMLTKELASLKQISKYQVIKEENNLNIQSIWSKSLKVSDRGKSPQEYGNTQLLNII